MCLYNPLYTCYDKPMSWYYYPFFFLALVMHWTILCCLVLLAMGCHSASIQFQIVKRHYVKMLERDDKHLRRYR